MENPPFVSLVAEYGPVVIGLNSLMLVILIVSDPGVGIRAKALWTVLRSRWSQSRR